MVDSEGGRLSRPDDDEEFEEAFGVLTAHAATTVREFAVGQTDPGPRNAGICRCRRAVWGGRRAFDAPTVAE